MVETNGYDVIWANYARINLAKMAKYKVDPNQVFRKSKTSLSKYPRQTAYDVLQPQDHVGSEFIGYYWTLINNVIIVYEILDDERKVLVDASFFANTAWAHYVFWNIEPEDWDDLDK